MKFLRLHEDIKLLDVGNQHQLIGAIYSGETGPMLVPFPDTEMSDLLLLEEHPQALIMDSTEFAEFLNQSDQLNVVAIDKAILRKSQRQVDSIVAWRVYKRDGYMCRYCGNDNVPLTLDHATPYENYGATVESNLLTSCRKCNRLKANMEYPIWLSSDTYRERSRSLSDEQRVANVAMMGQVANVPRVKVRSR